MGTPFLWMSHDRSFSALLILLHETSKRPGFLGFDIREKVKTLESLPHFFKLVAMPQMLERHLRKRTREDVDGNV